VGTKNSGRNTQGCLGSVVHRKDKKLLICYYEDLQHQEPSGFLYTSLDEAGCRIGGSSGWTFLPFDKGRAKGSAGATMKYHYLPRRHATRIYFQPRTAGADHVRPRGMLLHQALCSIGSVGTRLGHHDHSSNSRDSPRAAVFLHFFFWLPNTSRLHSLLSSFSSCLPSLLHPL
jgi:hypothetical protein